MEHWGFTDEVKKHAKRRRRINDKSETNEQSNEIDKPLK